MTDTKFKAVIFDLDGTLLDTLDDISSSMNRALVRHGFPVHPPADYKLFVGDGMETLARRVVPADQCTESTVKSCVAAMRVEYGLHWADKTEPYPGIREMLDALATRNLILGVLSNKPDDFSKAVVARFFPAVKFGAVAGAKAGIPIKPNPASAIAMAAALGLEPGRCVFVGDTNVDMQTAVGAGMFPVGVLWGFRTGKELSESGAKLLIEKPSDLLHIL